MEVSAAAIRSAVLPLATHPEVSRVAICREASRAAVRLAASQVAIRLAAASMEAAEATDKDEGE